MAEQDKCKPSEKEGKRAKDKSTSLKKTQSENSGQTLTINEEKKGTSFIGNSSVGVKKIHWQKIICCFFNLMKDIKTFPIMRRLFHIRPLISIEIQNLELDVH